MIDVFNFLHDFNSAESLKERNQAANNNDDRNVTDLLTDQVILDRHESTPYKAIPSLPITDIKTFI